MVAGKGGPTSPDLRDRMILERNPEAYANYFDGRGNFRISQAVALDLRLKQLSNTVSKLVEDVSKIEAMLGGIEEWNQAGASKARGRLRGNKRKPASTSSS